MSSSTVAGIATASFSDLPTDIFLIIKGFLNPDDFFNLAHVCRGFNMLLKDKLEKYQYRRAIWRNVEVDISNPDSTSRLSIWELLFHIVADPSIPYFIKNLTIRYTGDIRPACSHCIWGTLFDNFCYDQDIDQFDLDKDDALGALSALIENSPYTKYMEILEQRGETLTRRGRTYQTRRSWSRLIERGSTHAAAALLFITLPRVEKLAIHADNFEYSEIQRLFPEVMLAIAFLNSLAIRSDPLNFDRLDRARSALEGSRDSLSLTRVRNLEIRPLNDNVEGMKLSEAAEFMRLPSVRDISIHKLTPLRLGTYSRIGKWYGDKYFLSHAERLRISDSSTIDGRGMEYLLARMPHLTALSYHFGAKFHKRDWEVLQVLQQQAGQRLRELDLIPAKHAPPQHKSFSSDLSKILARNFAKLKRLAVPIDALPAYKAAKISSWLPPSVESLQVYDWSTDGKSIPALFEEHLCEADCNLPRLQEICVVGKAGRWCNGWNEMLLDQGRVEFEFRVE
ncbi:hypothetical protein NA57DRAFT_81037 [Rhizodiscina lignyota]|uniref:F-box domain-containing protein n=1 Tax=Rhizodiscina lignyota TaxID=1504668 RepID=A0A9P4M1J7_9PEZI|nr:hypothetical protein NA57DRAFT_81037 [Rhizodiscina lignyota]